jgi:hypothetical protein
MSDSDEQVCPLCCEELDISDQNFLPCKCGYQARCGVRGENSWRALKLSGRCAPARRRRREQRDARRAPGRAPGPPGAPADTPRRDETHEVPRSVGGATPPPRRRRRDVVAATARETEGESHMTRKQLTTRHAGLHVVLAPHQGEPEQPLPGL